MLTAEWNVSKRDEMNNINKERGIRNFFRMVHDNFNHYNQPLTHKGSPINYNLHSYGGINTKDYELFVVTSRNNIEVIENGSVIYKVRSKREFDAKKAYSLINY